MVIVALKVALRLLLGMEKIEGRARERIKGREKRTENLTRLVALLR